MEQGEEMLSAPRFEVGITTPGVDALAFAAEPQHFELVLSRQTMPVLASTQSDEQMSGVRAKAGSTPHEQPHRPEYAVLARSAYVNGLCRSRLSAV